MTIVEFLRIIHQRWMIILACGLVLAMLVYLSPEKEPVYTSQMTLNTGLVSGFNLDRNTGVRIDYRYTNYEMENIITVARSMNTLQSVSIRLLATVLTLKGPDTLIIQEKNRQELLKRLGADCVDKIRRSTVMGTEAIIRARIDNNRSDPLYQLIHSKHPFFGVKTLAKSAVKRIPGTDMLRLVYESTDPGICQQTIKLLADVITENHREVKVGQSNDVIEFFRKQMAKSAVKLRESEDDLLGFMVSKRIINYYEQTKAIAGRKEKLDMLYNEEVRSFVAADSAITRLEFQMRDFGNLPRLNRLIEGKREALSRLNAEIFKLELVPNPKIPLPDSAVQKLAELKEEAQLVQQQIRQAVTETMTTVVTPDNLQMRSVLDRWLLEVLKMEERRARIAVIEEQKLEFMEIYNQFAPSGSTIKRIEREIGVNEREYLENLDSYNQAWLNRINAMMSATLRPVDPPLFPTEAQPSNKLMLIVLAFIGGLVVPLAFFVAKELLDRSLKTVHRAEQRTGLSVIAAMPFLSKRQLVRPRPTDKEMIQKSMEQMAAAAFKHTRYSFRVHPVVGVFSTRKGSGKSWVSNQFARFLRVKGYTITSVTAEEWLAQREAITESMDPTKKGFVLVEVPALLEKSGWHEVLNDLDLAVVVLYARSVWAKADARILETIREMGRQEFCIYLNGVPVDSLETIIGEVPKRRSLWRRWLKRVVSFQLSGGVHRAVSRTK